MQEAGRSTGPARRECGELRSQDPALLAYHQQQKIEGLRERSTSFARAVIRG